MLWCIHYCYWPLDVFFFFVFCFVTQALYTHLTTLVWELIGNTLFSWEVHICFMLQASVEILHIPCLVSCCCYATKFNSLKKVINFLFCYIQYKASCQRLLCNCLSIFYLPAQLRNSESIFIVVRGIYWFQSLDLFIWCIQTVLRTKHRIRWHQQHFIPLIPCRLPYIHSQLNDILGGVIMPFHINTMCVKTQLPVTVAEFGCCLYAGLFFCNGDTYFLSLPMTGLSPPSCDTCQDVTLSRD